MDNTLQPNWREIDLETVEAIKAVRAGQRVFDYIQAGAHRDDLVNAVKQKFNCQEAEITDAGEIWIAGPQLGHWLSADQVDEFCDWLEHQG